MSKVDLKLDWATHKAAKFACENWHYSGSMPTPPLVKIGVWEDSLFVGVVLFSRGSSNNLLKAASLSPSEGCELTRIALRQHKTPVSRIVRIAIKELVLLAPELRLVVSFADPGRGHNGSIYQAGNWTYTGQSAPHKYYKAPDGKIWHPRMVKKKGWTTAYGVQRRTWRPDQCEIIDWPGKHRYLMPLDAEMRKRIEPLAKPYPKREKQAMTGSTSTATGQHRSSRSTAV